MRLHRLIIEACEAILDSVLIGIAFFTNQIQTSTFLSQHPVERSPNTGCQLQLKTKKIQAVLVARQVQPAKHLGSKG